MSYGIDGWLNRHDNLTELKKVQKLKFE